MTKLRITLTMAASVAALTLSANSYADDEVPDTGQLPQTTPFGAGSQEQRVPTGEYTQPTPPVPGATTTQTTAAPYVPPGGEVYEEKTSVIRPNPALLATGGALLVGTWGASAIVGGLSDTDADKNMWIPVVGPWLNLSERECTLGDCGSQSDFHNWLIIGSGVAQGAGALLALSSLFIPQTEKKEGLPSAKPTVRFTPMQMGRGGTGVGAVGTF